MIVCFVASVIVPFVGYMPSSLAIYCFCIAIIYAAITKFWFPIVRTPFASDMVAMTIFGLGAIGNFLGSYQLSEDGTPISQAFLIILACFAFCCSLRYSIYVVFILVFHCMARLANGSPLTVDYYNLIVLGPVFASLTRFGVFHLRKQTYSARSELQNKVDELQREKELRLESDRKLVYAQKMEGLGLLAAGVAHDFNNHLQAISSLTELLQLTDDEPTTERTEFYKHIRSATNDAAQICGRMLAYSGKRQDEMQTLDVVALLRSARPILSVSVSQPAVIEFALPTTPLFAKVNSTALQQCVTNLIQNARDSLPDGHGNIKVQAFAANLAHYDYDSWRSFGDPEKLAASPKAVEHVVIEVSDTGEGMSERTLESMFDPYFTTKPNGHGFGLSTTLGIVRSFQGVIRCKTELGQGTTIQILLPLLSAVSVSKHPESQDSAPRLAIKNILLVEDDILVLKNTVQLLQMAGFQVTASDNPKDALIKIESAPNSYDVLLVDYSMPEMTGIEFLERVRARGIETKVILCSGYAETSISEQKDFHPDVFLPKPYELSTLKGAFTRIENAS